MCLSSNLLRGISKSCGCLRNEAGLWRRLRPYEWLYNHFCYTSRHRRIPQKVEISYEDLLWYTEITKCHYCFAEVVWVKYKKRGGVSCYNLDRTDNSKGYSKENCVVCCTRCNQGKRDLFTYEEWWAMTEIFRRRYEQTRYV